MKKQHKKLIAYIGSRINSYASFPEGSVPKTAYTYKNYYFDAIGYNHMKDAGHYDPSLEIEQLSFRVRRLNEYNKMYTDVMIFIDYDDDFKNAVNTTKKRLEEYIDTGVIETRMKYQDNLQNAIK